MMRIKHTFDPKRYLKTTSVDILINYEISLDEFMGNNWYSDESFFIEYLIKNQANEIGRLEKIVNFHPITNDDGTIPTFTKKTWKQQTERDAFWYYKKYTDFLTKRLSDITNVSTQEKQSEPLDLPNLSAVKKNIIVFKEKHGNIFSNNGFVLFEHILDQYVKIKRGRLSDIHYFYWAMFNDTNKFIHQRPEPFKEWFSKTYLEDLGKIKTLQQVQNPDRDKHYSNALDWFKTQNQ
jgi:hypothetical protein